MKGGELEPREEMTGSVLCAVTGGWSGGAFFLSIVSMWFKWKPISQLFSEYPISFFSNF